MADPNGANSDTSDFSRDGGDSDSDSESPPLADLAASLRFLSESMQRMEAAEKEMAKAREASRIEAEKRRTESEAKVTQILLQSQSQIASLAKGTNRKRKRVERDDDSGGSDRERALLLSALLHINSMW